MSVSINFFHSDSEAYTSTLTDWKLFVNFTAPVLTKVIGQWTGDGRRKIIKNHPIDCRFFCFRRLLRPLPFFPDVAARNGDVL